MAVRIRVFLVDAVRCSPSTRRPIDPRVNFLSLPSLSPNSFLFLPFILSTHGQPNLHTTNDRVDRVLVFLCQVTAPIFSSGWITFSNEKTRNPATKHTALHSINIHFVGI